MPNICSLLTFEAAKFYKLSNMALILFLDACFVCTEHRKAKIYNEVRFNIALLK